MKLFLLILLLNLAGTVFAGVHLASRKAQCAVLQTLGKNITDSQTVFDSSVVVFLNELIANVPNREYLNRIFDIRRLNVNLLLGAAEIALNKMEIDKGLTPLQALEQAKEGIVAPDGRVNVRSAAIDVLINLLENEEKVAKFLTLSDHLEWSTDVSE